MTLSAEAIEWAKNRGISEQTLTRMRVGGGRARFGDAVEESIAFQYFRGEERVNYKARALARKAFKQQTGGAQIAYNWDAVREGPLDCVYIVEGEMDALSLIEAGLDSVISCPAGAPAESSEDPAAGKRYAWLIDAMGEGLRDAARYVLAVDADGPGRALRSDLVAILGAAKTHFVDWPEGIKDANEFLMAKGATALREHLTTQAKPWPVKGLWTMSQIPEPPPLTLWDSGFLGLRGKIHIAPTMLSVVTGYPGHGKSHLMQQMWFQIARAQNIRVAIFSAETRLKPFLRRNFRQFHAGQREVLMTNAQIAAADAWIEDHLVLMDVGDETPTMGWLIDSIEVAVQRHGCQAALIDPWNKIEEDYDPRETTETRWIGRMLDLLIQMSRGLNIHTQIIAHPAKPDGPLRKFAPDLYSISGSSHWANRVDQGFSVYREKLQEGTRPATTAELRMLKTRFSDLGHPATYSLEYDLMTGKFEVSDEA